MTSFSVGDVTSLSSATDGSLPTPGGAGGQPVNIGMLLYLALLLCLDLEALVY